MGKSVTYVRWFVNFLQTVDGSFFDFFSVPLRDISESSSEIYMNRKLFHDNLTLPKSTEKHPLKLNKKVASNPCGLDSSTGRAADRYPEGASSNPAVVNIFQLTSAVLDHHEKTLLKREHFNFQF